MATSTTPRLFYFDLARALLMFLGVPYHVARIYGDGRENIVLSLDKSSFLHFLAEFLHSFRMESFFIVAGFFSLLTLMRDSTGGWLKGRMIRIAVPLAACTILFAPVFLFIRLEYDRAMGVADNRHTFLELLADSPIAIMHLWFLHALLLLTIFLGICAFVVRGNATAREGVTRLSDLVQRTVGMPFWLGGLILMIPAALIWMLAPPPSPFYPMYFINKAWIYAPFFLFGCLMAARPALRDWVIAKDGVAILLGVLFSLLFIWGVQRHVRIAEAIGASAAGLFWLHAILSLASRHFDRHSPVVAYLCDASFTVYLFHLPIALLLAIPLLDVSFPPVLEWAALVAVTTCLSVLVHEVIRRSATLSLLFNGVSPRKYRRKAAAQKPPA